MRVLVVFANPRGTDSLRLGEEDRTIKECIRRSKHRDEISLTVLHAATIDDVRRALLDDGYEVVHFSGHGTGAGLAFEDANARLYVPPRDALAGLLSDFSPPIQCLLLNACYSTSQGRYTSLGVPYTIAMEGPVSDDAAVIFTGGFYDGIGAGREVEFAFRQGLHALKLAGHPDSSVPQLLRKGEYTASEPPPKVVPKTSVPPRGETSLLLLGIGIDVSGSMKESINSTLGKHRTRLEGFSDAFEGALSKYRGSIQVDQESGDSIRMFAYAFGLRNGDVCDLFSLIRAADGIITDAEIERLKQRYSDEIRGRYSGGSGFGDLGSLASRYGLGGVVRSVEQQVRADAENEVRNRIMAEVQTRLTTRLNTIGDTTLTLEQLADFWKGDSPTWSNAENLIFGNTPMCEALTKINARFEAELKSHPERREMPVLLLVSDGEPTDDGDPRVLAEKIRQLGVTIICCYITSKDVWTARTLVAFEEQGWPAGARLMFNMASEIEDDSPLVHFLLRKGWSVSPNAKTFVQVNHSEVLEELIGLAMSPLDAGHQLLPEGR